MALEHVIPNANGGLMIILLMILGVSCGRQEKNGKLITLLIKMNPNRL